jgi:hypothetical protein
MIGKHFNVTSLADVKKKFPLPIFSNMGGKLYIFIQTEVHQELAKSSS